VTIAASSLVVSASAASRTWSHQANGLNQKIALWSWLSTWTVKSRCTICDSSWPMTARRLGADQPMNEIGTKMTRPNVTGARMRAVTRTSAPRVQSARIGRASRTMRQVIISPATSRSTSTVATSP